MRKRPGGTCRYAVPAAPAYVWTLGYWAPAIGGHIWIGGHWRIR
jgi:hypothetical protein